MRPAHPPASTRSADDDNLSGMPQERSATITAHVAASPERVYFALTDADALTAWYWPASVEPKATSDPRVGGLFGVTTADAAMGFDGEYLELEPPRRIVQTWHWAGDEDASRVTIELSAAADGTDIVVTHDQLDEATVEPYRAGWQSCLDRLPDHLAG
jgi:uncharacterized protein YndB with AHSA1/START domain